MTEKHTCFSDLHLQRKASINLFKMHVTALLHAALQDEPVMRFEHLTKEIDSAVAHINTRLSRVLVEVQEQFPHVGESTHQHLTASCRFCGKALGWKCPDNQNGYCEYSQASDNPQDWEICIHCGHPEERK